MKIKYIIFDLDGVLISSKQLHFLSLNMALKDVDEKYIISYDEHIHSYDGLSTMEKLNRLSISKGLDESLHTYVWKKKQDYFFNMFDNHIKVDQKISTMFKTLKNDGFVLAIASNCISKTLDVAIKKLNIENYVDYKLSNEDVNHIKPSAEIYLKLMVAANMSPRETLILEDSVIGKEAAHRSGAHVMIVNTVDNVNYDNIINKASMFGSMDTQLRWENTTMNVLIPMAGKGQRFLDAGYLNPKPFIDIDGKTMIEYVIKNLNINCNYIFVVLKEHVDRFNLYEFFNRIVPNNKIIQVDSVTDGAAVTTLLAKNYIENENPLLIANSDQFIEWDSDKFYYMCNNSEFDASILTFKSSNPKWSYVKTCENGNVIEVAEKNPISQIATVGIYYWKRGKDYVNYAEKMIEKNLRINNEFYVCPVFNEAILDGKKIRTYEINKMWGLGTPEDLKVFIRDYIN